MRMDNEADVREEFVTPLLAKLGYRKGSENNIERELHLYYPNASLGREKKSDPPLRGRADYVLSVLGFGRWVLEVKQPNSKLSPEEINQCLTYARHPEVSAAYAALTNGQKFVVYRVNQLATENPLCEVDVTSIENVYQKLLGFLSPDAIRRDLRPPVIDLKDPLAKGLRSRVKVVGGHISHSTCEVVSNLPQQASEKFEDLKRMLTGWNSHVTSGEIYRSDQGRIRGKLTWAAPRKELLEFMNNKALNNWEYVSSEKVISTQITKPTLIEVVGDTRIEEGERVFDMLTFQQVESGLALVCSCCGQANIYLEYQEDMPLIKGSYSSRYKMTYPQMPQFFVEVLVSGELELQLDAG